MTEGRKRADIAILGGGLAGGMIALALARVRPDLSLLLIERETTLGGNHVWSFFASDLSAEGRALVEPLIAARWDGYSVRFPGLSRELSGDYRSITSSRFDAVLRDTLAPGAVLSGAQATVIDANTLALADGQTITAGAVIDARGAAGLPHLVGGWQKFVGQFLRTTRPHGLTRPVVMDAAVDQLDGYRFVYCLPFAPDVVFVEDTYYSDSPQLDVAALRGRIGAYAAAQDWDIAEVTHEETGVLPVVAGGNRAAFHRAIAGEGGGGMAAAGVKAGLFHPLTSYSLPTAVAFALDLARVPDLSGTGLAAFGRAWSDRHWQEGRFYRMLSAMLFGAAAPAERYKVLRRFYGLDERLIERFYAGQTTMADKARILTGKPPVPLGAAVRAIAGLAPLARLDDTLGNTGDDTL